MQGKSEASPLQSLPHGFPISPRALPGKDTEHCSLAPQSFLSTCGPPDPSPETILPQTVINFPLYLSKASRIGGIFSLSLVHFLHFPGTP